MAAKPIQSLQVEPPSYLDEPPPSVLVLKHIPPPPARKKKKVNDNTQSLSSEDVVVKEEPLTSSQVIEPPPSVQIMAEVELPPSDQVIEPPPSVQVIEPPPSVRMVAEIEPPPSVQMMAEIDANPVSPPHQQLEVEQIDGSGTLKIKSLSCLIGQPSAQNATLQSIAGRNFRFGSPNMLETTTQLPNMSTSNAYVTSSMVASRVKVTHPPMLPNNQQWYPQSTVSHQGHPSDPRMSHPNPLRLSNPPPASYSQTVVNPNNRFPSTMGHPQPQAFPAAAQQNYTVSNISMQGTNLPQTQNFAQHQQGPLHEQYMQQSTSRHRNIPQLVPISRNRIY